MLSADSSRGAGSTGWIEGVRLAGWLLVVCSVALAQYPPGGYPPGGYPPGAPGTYPPGTYPPGTYPPGQGPGGGIPLPTRGKNKPANNAPMPSFRGNLKQMDEKTITIELDDHRDMQFRRNGKTKFIKNGEEVKSPKFDMGDQLSIEGPEDAEGFFTAVNVYWERSAKSLSTDTASDKRGENVPDAWKDDAGKAAPPAAAPPAGAPPAAAAPPDPDDPGPPKLTRGRAADPEREHAADNPTKPTPPPNYTPAPPPAGDAGGNPPVLDTGGTPPAARGGDDAGVPRRPGDPLIAKAVEAALDFTEGLPNYMCQEMMTRYQSTTRPANWSVIDVVTTALIYDKGKEDYRDVSINGKATKKSIDQIGGSWSTGEFGTVLVDLMSPATAAQFQYRRQERQSGILAKVYDFSVKRENSHWQITVGSQTYRPPYKGSVWIDPGTGRVLRIEMQATSFPDDFPTDDVETALDYQYTRLGDTREYLLPVHSESLSCQRGSDFCSHNVIDFRNYHKYSGESTITFDSLKK